MNVLVFFFLCILGADIELGASSPLMEAAQEGHVDIVKFLIEKGEAGGLCMCVGAVCPHCVCCVWAWC